MASITTELVETGAKRDGRGRRIATPAERVALIAQYRDSGLTQRAFAEREGIKFSTFTSWVQGRRFAGRPGRKVHFAEVPMMTPPGLNGLTVQLPDGVVVRGANVSEVAALVAIPPSMNPAWSLCCLCEPLFKCPGSPPPLVPSCRGGETPEVPSSKSDQ